WRSHGDSLVSEAAAPSPRERWLWRTLPSCRPAIVRRHPVMSIQFRCCHCKTVLSVGAYQPGRPVTCPVCRGVQQLHATPPSVPQRAQKLVAPARARGGWTRGVALWLLLLAVGVTALAGIWFALSPKGQGTKPEKKPEPREFTSVPEELAPLDPAKVVNHPR